jgi:hypothetical protein
VSETIVFDFFELTPTTTLLAEASNNHPV